MTKRGVWLTEVPNAYRVNILSESLEAICSFDPITYRRAERKLHEESQNDEGILMFWKMGKGSCGITCRI